MKKPVIGLIPLWDDDKDSIWMLPGYVNGILEAGGIPVVLPYTQDTEVLAQVCGGCSGFLLTGGHDVDPSVYNAARTEFCGISCPTRDNMERFVLQYALEHDIAVLGICRGIQFMNAALGGTLYQDLPREHPTSTEHHQEPPYDRAVHRVEILPETPLYELLRTGELEVNSYHHQAIREISPRLQPMAVSEDGLIEAVCVPGQRFAWAVQWHPEFSYSCDESAASILKAFVLAACE